MDNDTIINIFRYWVMFWILLMLPSIVAVWFCISYEVIREFNTERKYSKSKKEKK